MGNGGGVQKTLSNVCFVLVADIVVKVVTASTALLLATLLTPEQYGLWVTLLLIVSYAPIVALGSNETLVKQYPFHTGTGAVAMARRTEEGVFGSIIIAATILLAATFVVTA